MASVVDICNAALAHIGAESLVTSIDPPDGSTEAGYCKTFYPLARRSALEVYNWAFARVRVQLSEVENQSTVWQYAYAVPAKCLTARRILPLAYIQSIGLQTWPMGFDSPIFNWKVLDDLFNERGSSDFEIEGDVLYTNEPDAWLLYTTDITDSSKFSPMFTTALAMLLAGYLAGPIIKGREAINIGTAWTEAGNNMLGKAIANDANASAERSEFVAEAIKVRA